MFVLSATPAWAVKEWYDYYLEAREELIPAKKYAEAIKSLEAAVRLRPAASLNEQTYGLRFVDYVPYYWQGVCYLRTGDFNSAIRMMGYLARDGAGYRLGNWFFDRWLKRVEASRADAVRP